MKKSLIFRLMNSHLNQEKAKPPSPENTHTHSVIDKDTAKRREAGDKNGILRVQEGCK